jgi:hypothetical protein
MSTIVRCPNCDASFSQPEDAEGPLVECPACGIAFEQALGRTNNAPALAVRNFDLGAAALESGALPLLLRGSLLQIFANLLYLLAVLLVMGLLLHSLDQPGGRTTALVLNRFLILACAFSFLAAWFLNVIAASCWAMAPTKGVSRGLGVAVLCFSVLVVFRNADFLLLLPNPAGHGSLLLDAFHEPRSGLTLLFVSSILDVVRMMVLAGYLAAVARETGARHRPAALLATLAPFILMGPIPLFVLVGVLGGAGLPIMTLSVFLVFGTLVVVTWTLLILFQLRGAWDRMSRPAWAGPA